MRISEITAFNADLDVLKPFGDNWGHEFVPPWGTLIDTSTGYSISDWCNGITIYKKKSVKMRISESF